MSNDGQNYITKEGLTKLEAELHELKTVKRKEISSRIQEAKELGDLSENAEYAEARNEQSFTEGRIMEIENMFKNMVVIDDAKAGGEVRVGSTIKVKSDSGEREFVIVGSNEADPLKGRISNESPLGEGFLGKKVGDTVEVTVPKGVVTYKILAIS